ncbi:MAG TPA: hypothetical protein VFI76_06020, partial [Terrimicrobiaceae bacterium]|nr:hypothetical protein [Terrimicrobiaceae bacterium]
KSAFTIYTWLTRQWVHENVPEPYPGTFFGDGDPGSGASDRSAMSGVCQLPVASRFRETLDVRAWQPRRLKKIAN